MAVTAAVTDLEQFTLGGLRGRTGTLTFTGTTTDNGDALTAQPFGLDVIVDLSLRPALDSASNPENSFLPVWIKSTGKVVFVTAASTSAATPLAVITDGTDVSTYFCRFFAVGR